MNIENYREQSPVGPVLAIFDVYVPTMGLTFKNLKLVKSKKGTTFINYPSYSEEDEMGQKKWFPYVSFSPERKKEFETKLRKELVNFCPVLV